MEKVLNTFKIMRTIKELKEGDFFRLSSSGTAPVWVRGEYNRSTKKYECYKFDDVNHWSEFTSTRKVTTDFEF